jgi:Mrp family chromosome partitioning ATPase
VRGLRQIGAHLIGIVLNGLPAQNRGYYSYYQAEEEKISQPRRIWNKSLATAQQLFKKQG